MREVGGSSPSSPISRTRPPRGPLQSAARLGPCRSANSAEHSLPRPCRRGPSPTREQWSTHDDYALDLARCRSAGICRRARGTPITPVSPAPTRRRAACPAWTSPPGCASASGGRTRTRWASTSAGSARRIPGLGEGPEQLRGALCRAGRQPRRPRRSIGTWRGRRRGLPRPAGGAGPAGGPRGVLRVHHDRRRGGFPGLGHGAPPARGCAMPRSLVEARNRFVQEMGQEMSYWAAWPLLAPDEPAAARRRPTIRPRGAARRAQDAAARPARPRGGRHPPPGRPSPRAPDPGEPEPLRDAEARARRGRVVAAGPGQRDRGARDGSRRVAGHLDPAGPAGLPGAERGRRPQLVGQGAAGGRGARPSAPSCFARRMADAGVVELAPTMSRVRALLRRARRVGVGVRGGSGWRSGPA